MAAASASLLKSAPVLDKSEWVKGQNLRQPSVSVVRCLPTAPSALTVRASSYADELVKTAVCVYSFTTVTSNQNQIFHAKVT